MNEHEQYTKSIQNNAAGFYKLFRVLLIIMMLGCGKCVFGQQPLFQFYTTETDISIDNGETETIASITFVYAIADTITILIPSTQSVAFTLSGLTWVPDSRGGFEASGLLGGWAKYSEGMSGKTLEIKFGALHMVCKERKSRKTTRL